MQAFFEKLNKRYAVKRMNGATVPQEKVDAILQAIQLAPSSAGLQPYHIFCISDKALLKQISEEACKQPQILEGSHLLVFTYRTDINEKFINDFIAHMANVRNIPVESLEQFRQNLLGIASLGDEDKRLWASNQAYIALGFGIIAAAEAAVDATPMEGFDKQAMDRVLGLEAKNLRSAAILMLGERDEANDYLFGAKKVRRTEEDLFTKI